MNIPFEIKKTIEEHLDLKIASGSTLGGGCISDAKKIKMENGELYLLKINQGSGDMFEKEANGLRELAKANAVRVPAVLMNDKDFILLEFIESGRKVKNFFENFGRKFAELHKFSSDSFGFYEDNYIGSTPQKNVADEKEKESWKEFYFNKRLLFQLKLAERKGHLTSELSSAFSNLENKYDTILSGGKEAPSLLHGDLWSGNYMPDENGEACLIDPAVYYGNREADLGMTKLFGGFSSDFYKAYNEEFPLDDGYEYRENIYKLYHVLNHLNLFGGGYYSQAVSLIKYYL